MRKKHATISFPFRRLHQNAFCAENCFMPRHIFQSMPISIQRTATTNGEGKRATIPNKATVQHSTKIANLQWKRASLTCRILHMHNPGTAAFIIFMRVPSRGRPGESVHHNYHSVAHALLFCYVQLPNYNEEKLQCIGVLRLSGRGVGEGEEEEVQTTGLAANPSRQASERAFFAYYRPDTVCHILRNVHQINVAAAALPAPLLR